MFRIIDRLDDYCPGNWFPFSLLLAIVRIGVIICLMRRIIIVWISIFVCLRLFSIILIVYFCSWLTKMLLWIRFILFISYSQPRRSTHTLNLIDSLFSLRSLSSYNIFYSIMLRFIVGIYFWSVFSIPLLFRFDIVPWVFEVTILFHAENHEACWGETNTWYERIMSSRYRTYPPDMIVNELLSSIYCVQR